MCLTDLECLYLVSVQILEIRGEYAERVTVQAEEQTAKTYEASAKFNVIGNTSLPDWYKSLPTQSTTREESLEPSSSK